MHFPLTKIKLTVRWKQVPIRRWWLLASSRGLTFHHWLPSGQMEHHTKAMPCNAPELWGHKFSHGCCISLVQENQSRLKPSGRRSYLPPAEHRCSLLNLTHAFIKYTTHIAVIIRQTAFSTSRFFSVSSQSSDIAPNPRIFLLKKKKKGQRLSGAFFLLLHAQWNWV